MHNAFIIGFAIGYSNGFVNMSLNILLSLLLTLSLTVALPRSFTLTLTTASGFVIEYDIEMFQIQPLNFPKFPLVPMGVLAPGSAHARPSAQPPIDTSRNFWRTCLQSNLQIFQEKNIKSPPGGQGGSPIFLGG